MLRQKRTRFFQDSGINMWEVDELKAAEVAGLQRIHRIQDVDDGRT